MRPDVRAGCLVPAARFDSKSAEVELRTLVIGFGNLYRADDGLAYYVVNTLRRGLGQPPLGDDESGLDCLGRQIDSVFLPQLVPELIDVLSPYRTVVFVDASVGGQPAALDVQQVHAQLGPSAFTHHIGPAMLVALAKSRWGCDVSAHAVSICGLDFSFKCGLSPEVERMVPAAVERVLGLAANC